MKNLLTSAIAAPVVLAASGCATVLQGTSQRIEVISPVDKSGTGTT